jgi:hypothetical protein
VLSVNSSGRQRRNADSNRLKTQIPIFAWSSQARGFFTDRAGRDKVADPTLVNCWYSDVNFARRDRVHELAHRLAGADCARLFICTAIPDFPSDRPRDFERV